MNIIIEIINKMIDEKNEKSKSINQSIKECHKMISFLAQCEANFGEIKLSSIDEYFDIDPENEQGIPFIKFIIEEKLFDRFSDVPQVANAISALKTQASFKSLEAKTKISELNAQLQENFKQIAELNKRKKDLFKYNKNTYIDKDMFDFISGIISISKTYSKEVADLLFDILKNNLELSKGKEQVEEVPSISEKQSVIDEVVSEPKNIVEEPVLRKVGVEEIQKAAEAQKEVQVKNSIARKSVTSYRQHDDRLFSKNSERERIKNLPSLTNGQIEFAKNANDPEVTGLIISCITKYQKITNADTFLPEEYVLKYVKAGLYMKYNKFDMLKKAAFFFDKKGLENVIFEQIRGLYYVYSLLRNVKTKQSAEKDLTLHFDIYDRIFEKFELDKKSYIQQGTDTARDPLALLTNLKIEEKNISNIEKKEKSPVPFEKPVAAPNGRLYRVKKKEQVNAEMQEFDSIFNPFVKELEMCSISSELTPIREQYNEWLEIIKNNKDYFMYSSVFKKVISEDMTYDKLIDEYKQLMKSFDSIYEADAALISARAFELAIRKHPAWIYMCFNEIQFKNLRNTVANPKYISSDNVTKLRVYVDYLEKYAKANNDAVFLQVIDYIKKVDSCNLSKIPSVLNFKKMQAHIISLIMEEPMSTMRAIEITRIISAFDSMTEELGVSDALKQVDAKVKA